jgi:hypothetical protein
MWWLTLNLACGVLFKMIKSSLSRSPPVVASYTGNEGIVVNSSVRFGRTTYIWDARFISFLDEFFVGTPIESTTRNVIDPVSKFVAFANGTLSPTDLQYDMISQYNDYLATLKLGE